MATSTIFNFNFNNSEIVDSTGQWYNATTGTPTTEFIEHDGNTALLQRAYIAETSYLRDINPVFFQSRDPTFTAHTYTIELQIYPLRDSGRFGPETGPVLDFNPATNDAESRVQLRTIQYGSASNTFYWKERYLGLDGDGIPFLTVTAADGTYNRWYSIRIERVDDGTNTGATIKIYVDGALVVNETLTYAQDARIGRIGDSIRYTYGQNSTDPQGAGVAIDNFKLTAGIAPSSVVDVSLANLQRNNANLLSFIKGKVPAVNDGTLTIQKNGVNVQTFTANASTNATANITVPTKTSDLTNDSGFITEDNTKIPLAGSNAISGSLIPSTDNSIDIGSSTKNIKALYTKGITIDGAQFLPSDYIPRIGGVVLAGQEYKRTVDDNALNFYGGKGYGHGAFLQLTGKDDAGGGGFNIQAHNGTTGVILNGKADGTLTWNGQSIQTVSDQRLKQQIAEIDDKLLDAWEDVNLVQFKYNDAVDQKGKDKARLHTGYVVQQIDSACKSHGVDVSAYGLYCHEEYPEETEEVEVEQADGTKVKEKKVIREASEHYSLRYTEAYAIECKYLRRCIKQLTTRIEQLTTRIEELEKGKEQEASK